MVESENISEHLSEHMISEASEQGDVSIASMLLGFVTFIMMLFTLVNLDDEDMRYYTWSVISSTIAIFVAVLMFDSVDSVVHEVLLKGMSDSIQIWADFFEMVLSMCILQMCVAWAAGVLKKEPLKRGITQMVHGEEVPFSVKEQSYQRCLHMKGCAMLFGHMSGFASISFGGFMQHGTLCREYPFLVFAAGPVMYIGLVLSGRVFRLLRKYLVHHGSFPGSPERHSYRVLSQDDSEDWPSDGGKQFLLAIYEDEVVETMNDHTALCVSFLAVQACRFNISGVMPDHLGVEHKHWKHPASCSLKLFGLAFLFTMVLLMLVRIKRLFPEEIVPGTCMSLLKRAVLVAGVSMAMSMAWSLLFTAKWELARNVSFFLGSPDTIKSRVILAVGLSLLSITSIAILDKIADSDHTDEIADEAVYHIIDAMGILVGFSWEQAFAGGVHVLAERTPHPVVTRLALASFVAMVVITPWSRYILNTAMKLKDTRKLKHELERLEAPEAPKHLAVVEASEKRKSSHGNHAETSSQAAEADAQLLGTEPQAEQRSQRGKFPVMPPNSLTPFALAPIIRLFDAVTRTQCSVLSRGGMNEQHEVIEAGSSARDLSSRSARDLSRGGPP